MKMVSDHSNRWRYEYNTRKSAVLVYGEDKKSHSEASKNRELKLGEKKGFEKNHHDLVGVNACKNKQKQENFECFHWNRLIGARV